MYSGIGFNLQNDDNIGLTLSTPTINIPLTDASILATLFCQFVTLFEQLWEEVKFLSSRILQVESKNLNLKMLNQVQDTLQPPKDATDAKILGLKNKHKKIWNQQATS